MADGSEITTTKARPRLGHSPQAKWQKAQQAKGNCRACGASRQTPEEAADNQPPRLRQHCRACQTKINEYMKKYRKNKRAQQGGSNGPDESSNPTGVAVSDGSAV